jgi:hypothetical protein
LERSERLRGYRDKALLILDAGVDAQCFVADADYRDDITGTGADPVAAAWRFLASIPWDAASESLRCFATLQRAPKIVPARLATLAIAWRAHQQFESRAFARIETWRLRDKHLWLFEANGRDHAASSMHI